ncbi:MAG: diguanylate cyclase [Proteobacteria bacterium]|nr:diguanylate cyclase [Pseudomonadota bacterium]
MSREFCARGAAQHAVGEGADHVVFGSRARELVALLEQDPGFLPLASLGDLHQFLQALQLLAVHVKQQLASGQALARVPDRLPSAAIPDEALLMVDVDHFKAINDALGHQAGDDCLRRLATVVREVSEREGGFDARYGGEEMAALLLDHGRPLVAAESLRQAIYNLEWQDRGPRAQKLLCRSGLPWPMPRRLAPEDLIAAADRALYAAKAAGRNRVAVDPREPVPEQTRGVVGA